MSRKFARLGSAWSSSQASLVLLFLMSRINSQVYKMSKCHCSILLRIIPRCGIYIPSGSLTAPLPHLSAEGACSSCWVSTVMPPREFLRGSQGRILSGVARASLSGEPICPLEKGPSLGYPCYLPHQYGFGIILDKCACKIF